MQEIEIHASPKQMSKLRNGHVVTIKKPVEGCGFTLLVDPSKYNRINRSFELGKGARINLSPSEISASTSIVGSGIGKKYKKKLSPILPSVIESAQTYLSHPEIVSGIIENNAGGPRNTLMPNSIIGAVEHVKLMDELNERLGTKFGVQTKASIANALSGKEQATMDASLIDAKRDSQLMGQGLYVGRGGRGRHPSFEGGSIGLRGGILRSMPQALQSQPFSANYQFSKTLPLAYQHITGNGLYI